MAIHNTGGRIMSHLSNPFYGGRAMTGQFTRIMVAAIAIIGFVTAVQATVYIDENFDADTTGGHPAGASSVVDDGVGGNLIVEIVDSISSPVDPFGGAGNKSLFMVDNAPKDTVNSPAQDIADVNFRGTVPVAGISQGTLTVDFYLTAADDYGFVRMGKTTDDVFAATELGWYIRMGGDGTLQYIANAGWKTFDQAISVATAHTLEITFDTDTDTFTGKVDSAALTGDSGATTAFNYFWDNTFDGLNMLQLRVGGRGDVGREMFFDNVKLVPEPASMALMMIGGLLCLRRRR